MTLSLKNENSRSFILYKIFLLNVNYPIDITTYSTYIFFPFSKIGSPKSNYLLRKVFQGNHYSSIIFTR